MQADNRSSSFSEQSASEHKILVVDDNDANRLVMGLMLEMLGYESDAVASGFEALAQVCENEYMGIMMDLRMPELDGLETTRRIRTAEQGTKSCPLPIIAVTAEAAAIWKDRCLAVGMNGFLTKPYTAAELSETIALLVSQKEAFRKKLQ